MAAATGYNAYAACCHSLQPNVLTFVDKSAEKVWVKRLRNRTVVTGCLSQVLQGLRSEPEVNFPSDCRAVYKILGSQLDHLASALALSAALVYSTGDGTL